MAGGGRRKGKGPGAVPAQPPLDEAGLWDRVKRTVDPLDAAHRDRYAQALADVLAQPELAPRPVRAKHPGKAGIVRHHEPLRTHPQAPAHPPARHPAPPKTPPLVALDRKTRSRIARGRLAIDARLDLHGLRQHEAHEVLRSFIWRSHARGLRTVLVITGKGTRARDPHPEAPPWAAGAGILRQAVPGWLADPDLRSAVLAVETAHPSHGGEGALYVRLRARAGDNR